MINLLYFFCHINVVFWLWSYIKDRVYAIHNDYTTLKELEEAISHELTTSIKSSVVVIQASGNDAISVWSKMVNILNSCCEIAVIYRDMLL